MNETLVKEMIEALRLAKDAICDSGRGQLTYNTITAAIRKGEQALEGELTCFKAVEIVTQMAREYYEEDTSDVVLHAKESIRLLENLKTNRIFYETLERIDEIRKEDENDNSWC